MDQLDGMAKMNNASSGTHATPVTKTTHETYGTSDQFMERILYSAIAFTLVAVFYADVQTPLGIAVWVLYIVPVTISLWLKQPVVPLFIATFITLLIIAIFLSILLEWIQP